MATKKKKKNKNKNEADSESNKIEEIGIRESMLFNYEINSNELLTMNHDELKSLIDSKLSEESFLVYRLDEWNGLDEGILNQSENTNLFLDEKLFKHSGDEKINCKVIYNEKNQLPELNENQVRLVFWEELNESSVSIDIAENIDNINLVINGNHEILNSYCSESLACRKMDFVLCQLLVVDYYHAWQKKTDLLHLYLENGFI